MGVSIHIDAHEVVRRLDALRSRLDNLEPVLDDIGTAIEERVRALFHDSQDPYGSPWEALKYREGQPLLNTGAHLRDTITHQASANDVRIGTPTTWAGVHQFGWDDKNIPARPFLPFGGLPDEWRDEVMEIVERHLTEALHGTR